MQRLTTEPVQLSEALRQRIKAALLAAEIPEGVGALRSFEKPEGVGADFEVTVLRAAEAVHRIPKMAGAARCGGCAPDT